MRLPAEGLEKIILISMMAGSVQESWSFPQRPCMNGLGLPRLLEFPGWK
jgi:hypothetical protein